MYKAFLIKYAEIAIKGKNRYIFEDALVDQIRYQLRNAEGTFKVVKEMGRIFVYPQGDFDYEEAVEAMKRVFGIYGIVWSQVTADTLTVLLSFYVYRRFRPGQEEMDRKRRQLQEKGTDR